MQKTNRDNNDKFACREALEVQKGDAARWLKPAAWIRREVTRDEPR